MTVVSTVATKVAVVWAAETEAAEAAPGEERVGGAWAVAPAEEELVVAEPVVEEHLEERAVRWGDTDELEVEVEKVAAMEAAKLAVAVVVERVGWTAAAAVEVAAGVGRAAGQMVVVE